MSKIYNQDSIFYKACPGDNYKRKVVEENGRYRCEYSGQIFDDYEPTYMFRAQISDFTESIQVTFPREQGDKIIGMSA